MLGCIMKLSTGVMGWVNRFRDLLFPPACVFCREPLADGGSLCEVCAGDIRIWPHFHCMLCGRAMPEHLSPGPCGRCLRRPPPQTRSESLYLYRDGPVRNAILDWKLQGSDAGVLWLLDTARPRLQSMFGPHSLLLPVPMPLSRMRRAGRHHAADLCRAIAERTGAQLDWQTLRRNGEQQRQSSLNGRARRKNLCKAFVVDTDHSSTLHSTDTPDTHIWVVDDIMTTGATMHYCCRALRRAGISCGAFSLTRLAGRD